jgi:S-adenosyl-L-methionine hydrolase (adenosine-forming)
VSLISLLTDFGTRDEYVGVMKAVIWGIAPQSQIVDIGHQVEPQDIYQAAFLLGAAYPYFGVGSVHVAVVDPGVGGDRRIVGMRFENQFFIAPDNGLLALVLNRRRPEELVEVSRSEFFLPRVGSTFHGRDIFAPVAAHLASGTALEALGPQLALDQLHRLSHPPAPEIGQGQIRGAIVQVDRFGNLTTNIGRRQLTEAQAPLDEGCVAVRVGGKTLKGLSACYADVPAGRPLVLMGSRELLEIAVNQGNARRQLEVSRGDTVEVVW